MKNHQPVYIMFSKAAFFGIVSIGVNFALQFITLYLYDGKYDIFLALMVGSLVGFAAKYALDRFFVYDFSQSELKQEVEKIMLYVSSSILGMSVFWGGELLLHFAFPHLWFSKYLGAILGMIVGYSLKFLIDLRYVFAK